MIPGERSVILSRQAKDDKTLRMTNAQDDNITRDDNSLYRPKERHGSPFPLYCFAILPADKRQLSSRIGGLERCGLSVHDRELVHEPRKLRHAKLVGPHRNEPLKAPARIPDRERAVCTKHDVDTR